MAYLSRIVPHFRDEFISHGSLHRFRYFLAFAQEFDLSTHGSPRSQRVTDRSLHLIRTSAL